MSAKNTLKAKGIRRAERQARKAYQERLRALAVVEETIAITPEERGEASGLVVAQSQLWTP